jgi:hypothetical protein
MPFKEKNMIRLKNAGFAAMTAALIWAAALPVSAEEKVVSDSWYAVYMMGTKVGWSHERCVEIEEGGKTFFLSHNLTELKIKRLNMVVEIKESSKIKEDAEGRLVTFEYAAKQSMQEARTVGKVVDGKLQWTTTAGGQSMGLREKPYDPACLSPRAIQRTMREKGAAKGTSYKMKIFLPQAPDQIVESTVTVGGQEDVELLGSKRRLVRLESMLNVGGMAIMSQTWVTENWDAVKVKNLTTQMELIRMPRELARQQGEVKEIFLRTIIPSNRKIENARKAQHLNYRLEMPEEKVFKTFPTGKRQSVTKKGEGFLEIEVKVQKPEAGAALPVKAEGMEDYLLASPYLQIGDERIKKIAAEVTSGETDALAAARKLEKWVFTNIKKKNFGVGFATAAEVARNLEGDCSEHGVLLAALCRAAGIPSRVVAGVIYADVLVTKESPGTGGFGFHMWTEVFVGSWVALDATLGVGFADATHIKLACSALKSESSMFDLVPVGMYIGKLKIEVKE